MDTSINDKPLSTFHRGCLEPARGHDVVDQAELLTPFDTHGTRALQKQQSGEFLMWKFSDRMTSDMRHDRARGPDRRSIRGAWARSSCTGPEM